MGKLHAIGSLEVRVFGRDHRPAHLHVLHPDGDALVDLFSPGVSRGTLPRQHRQEVMSRAILNRATLLAEWNRLDPTSRSEVPLVDDMPRIDAAAAEGPTILAVAWHDGGRSRIDLGDRLARPNSVLDVLSDPAIFARAAVGGHGGFVTWDDGEGDLAIDACHLRSIANEQARSSLAGVVDIDRRSSMA